MVVSTSFILDKKTIYCENYVPISKLEEGNIGTRVNVSEVAKHTNCIIKDIKQYEDEYSESKKKVEEMKDYIQSLSPEVREQLRNEFSFFLK